ncbi:MAG: epoxyqueuosine reductase [Methanobacteriaceae archaeon]|jgi:epoxyqueuosine reductase QueG|nr:epoxyqueuosine reductase [Candidatus Methanorudis spinitermitis]
MYTIYPNQDKKSLFLKKFEEKAKKLGINSIAYTKISPKIATEKDLKYSNAIVMTIKMWDEIIKESPSEKAKDMNSNLYKKFKEIAFILSKYLKENGHCTKLVIPNEKLLNLPMIAQKAGLGYIGKNKLLITPNLGPQVKIAAILTDIENLPFSKENEHSWVKNYCKECKKCIEGCEEGSLQNHPSNLEKSAFNQDKCTASTNACSYCIEKCPFYIEGYFQIREKNLG